MGTSNGNPTRWELIASLLHRRIFGHTHAPRFYLNYIFLPGVIAILLLFSLCLGVCVMSLHVAHQTRPTLDRLLLNLIQKRWEEASGMFHSEIRSVIPNSDIKESLQIMVEKFGNPDSIKLKQSGWNKFNGQKIIHLEYRLLHKAGANIYCELTQENKEWKFISVAMYEKSKNRPEEQFIRIGYPIYMENHRERNPDIEKILKSEDRK